MKNELEQSLVSLNLVKVLLKSGLAYIYLSIIVYFGIFLKMKYEKFTPKNHPAPTFLFLTNRFTTYPIARNILIFFTTTKKKKLLQ